MALQEQQPAGSWLHELFPSRPPLIGMLHAPPLPGSPRFAGGWQSLIDLVLRDAETLAKGGIDGLLLENYGDAPFYPGRVPRHVVASLTALACAVKGRFPLPLGINVLRNDGQSALAIAAAAGAQFVRANVLCGARVTDQGLIQGIAHGLLRQRRQLAADHVRVLADVNVKHSAPLAVRPLENEVDDLLSRGGAEGLIVSGAATGQAANPAELRQVCQAAAGRAPVLVGSGVTADTLAALMPDADGFIVGSSLKRGGRAENEVELARVQALRRARNL